MEFEHGGDGTDADTAAELRRAARTVQAVEVVESADDGVALRGDPESMRSVRRALWARQLSAEQHGQQSLANADASARGRLVESR